jgi:hypothetical protein
VQTVIHIDQVHGKVIREERVEGEIIAEVAFAVLELKLST